MNGKNIYSGNINSTPTYVSNKNNDLRNENQKYVATIVSENLRKNSVDNGDKKLDLKERENQKVKEKNNKEKEKKVSKRSEELLKMSVDYNDYDFNEWNKRIVDTYNPYAIDDLTNTSLSNYEKIKRIMAQEARYEKNFNKFENNLDNIYDDIKEKITNETLKIMYGEDNFEYVPNSVETYKENWTTGDEEADLLLKIYHSPKIKQRDISAQDYIAQKYNEFAKTIDGKQSFEVSAAKTGINPNDIVRVHLDKAYYMDDVSIAKNKDEQELYTRTILQNNGAGAGNKNSTLNRFGNKPGARPTPTSRPTNRPTPPPVNPSQQLNNDQQANNQNAFVFNNEEASQETSNTSENRVLQRREEWISTNHKAQLIERTDAEKKWDKLLQLQNQKLEELIIENGFEIKDINFNFDLEKEVVVLSSIIFDDEERELSKIKTIEKFAKKNKYELDIKNHEDKTQTITFKFSMETPVAFNEEGESLYKKITNLSDLVNNFDNIDDENYNIDNIEKSNAINDVDEKNELQNQENINNVIGTSNKKEEHQQSKKNDNGMGAAGITRMTPNNSSTINTKNNYNNKSTSNSAPSNKKNNGSIEVINEGKAKSLADVLAEKRNKNHQQMNSARINKKVSLQEAIDKFNKENHIDHGPRKKR